MAWGCVGAVVDGGMERDAGGEECRGEDVVVDIVIFCLCITLYAWCCS